jgi:hypothetical protein
LALEACLKSDVACVCRSVGGKYASRETRAFRPIALFGGDLQRSVEITSRKGNKMTWQPSKTTAGPYVAGSTDGRLRELEAQVSELTDMVDSLRRVIHIERGGVVRIVGTRSLTLSSPPARIALDAGKISATNGFAEKNIV